MESTHEQSITHKYPTDAMGLDLSTGFLMIVAGKSNSGKSHFIRWLFSELRNHFAYGVVFSNTSFEGAYDFIPDKFIHSDFDPEVIDNLIDVQEDMIKRVDKKAKKRGWSEEDKIAHRKNAFVLLDDCCAANEFKSAHIKKLAVQGRHYNITTILSTQYIHLCPPVLRANCNYGLFFNIGEGRAEMKATFDWIGGRFRTYEDFREYYYAAIVDHQFIMYHRDDAQYRVFRAPADIPRFVIRIRGKY